MGLTLSELRKRVCARVGKYLAQLEFKSLTSVSFCIHTASLSLVLIPGTNSIRKRLARASPTGLSIRDSLEAEQMSSAALSSVSDKHVVVAMYDPSDLKPK